MSRNSIRIEGDTVDKKFEAVERILRRLMMRSRERVFGVIPPIPIFGYAERPAEDGVIIRCVMPMKGVVRRACLAVGEYVENKPANFNVLCGGTERGYTKSFVTKKPIVVEELDYPISIGDRLVLSTPEPGSVAKIWVSILCDADVSDGRVKAIAFDELKGLE